MEAVKGKLETNLPKVGSGDVVGNVVKWLLYAAGLLAVVMIIISGVQMITSAGNSSAVAKAKNTLIYSIIGLVIVILAYVIVQFVIGRL